MRTAAGLIGGVIVAMAVLLGIELVGHLLFPIPAETGLFDPERAPPLRGAVPLPAELIMVAAWLAGATAGAAFAQIVSRRRWTAVSVAVLVAAAAVVMILITPHPAWMQIAVVVVPLAGGLLVAHLGVGLDGANADVPSRG